MKRLLILLALAGLGTAPFGCGDDDGGGDKPVQTGPDAAVAKPDAAVVSRGTQITNLAAECKTAADCMGTGTKSCLTDLGPLGGNIPGGYCTAECKTDDECGTNGACPVAALASNPLFGALGAIGGAIPSTCFQKCDSANPCARAGHVCRALADGLPPQFATIAALVPQAKIPFCFPPVELNDAGVRRPDAGTTRTATVVGMDSGI